MKQVIRDSVITFLFSFLCGLLLEYFDFSIPFKCGISGVVGLFAIFIYDILIKLLSQVEKNPIQYIKNWRKK